MALVEVFIVSWNARVKIHPGDFIAVHLNSEQIGPNLKKS